MALALLAYTDDGHKISRTVDTDDDAKVYELAERERLHIVDISPVDKTQRMQTKMPFIKEKADFYREIALYLEKGVNKKDRTADLLDLANPDSDWYDVLLSFLTAYEKKSLAEAMDLQPAVFLPFERNLVRKVTGENVPVVLRHLSTYFERVRDSRGKITNALIMPALQILGVFALIGLYMFQVVPSMRDMAGANDGPSDDPIPQSFVVLGNIHDWVVDGAHWPYLVAGVLTFALICWLISRTSGARRAYDWLLLNNRITFAYLLERRLLTLFIMGLIIEAGSQRNALMVARDSAIGPIFYEELNAAHRVNIGEIHTADGRKRVKWYEALASAKTVFDRRTRTLLTIADKRGILPEEITALIATLSDDLKRELQMMPQMLNLAATAVVFFSLVMLLVLFILPFSTYIAHFGA